MWNKAIGILEDICIKLVMYYVILFDKHEAAWARAEHFYINRTTEYEKRDITQVHR